MPHDPSTSDLDPAHEDSSVPSTVLPIEMTRYTAAPLRLPGGYEVIEQVGRGGMGVVYKARDARLNRVVAVKQMRRDVLGDAGLARFRREAEALAKLQHPNVVQVYGWEEADEPCIVMEYVAGGPLEERLPKGPMDPADAAKLIAVVARAVQYAHEQGIVHRDLKPANVLMGPAVAGSSGTVLGGFPRVADFGLARLAESDGQTATGDVIGTPCYMSPEQAAGRVREVGPAADVWALGVMLYRCLAGRLPFVGESALATLEAVKTAEPAVIEGVPGEVAAACLRKAPGERPRAREVAERLEAFVAGRPAVAEEPRRPGKKPRRRLAAGMTRRRVLMGTAGLLAAGVGVGLFGWLSKPVRIVSFRVVLIGVKGSDRDQSGVVGDLQKLPFNGLVTVEVEFSEPAYAYVMAFNPNGKEQQLYPVNEEGKGDASVVPGRVLKLDLPLDNKAGESMAIPLDDEPRGGLQAFAVVASRRRLPAYAEWRRSRGNTGWRWIEGVKDVWAADMQRMYRVRAANDTRGEPVAVSDGRPPLERLLAALRSGVEALEVLAVPVLAKEESR